ncbi:MAG: PLP-dependent aminotransferase family protein, partial [Burkholderiales bacterium]
YAELYFTERRPAPAKAHDRSGLVMHCSSFSKSLAPGFRVGWVAAGRFVPEVTRRKLSLNLGTSLPPQLALAEYLAHGAFDKHLRQLRTKLKKRQTTLAHLLARHFPEGTAATQPQGGYQLWVELPEGYDALELYWQASRHGVCFAPGPMFSPTRLFRNCLRLNYSRECGPEQEQGIELLGKLLRDQAAEGRSKRDRARVETP